ncbi:hypothetical protein [Halomonas alimentaria]|uniref:hypothetical protein n=1 Tax=Halomonas alimentaria TaxID=147248 RepID=UPI002492A115|nr:hypothetical protein [Halomonas alimentaria]
MKTFHKAPLALAITALMAAPYALADTSESSVESSFYNEIDVEIIHDSDSYKDFKTKIWTIGLATDYSGATVDSKQFSTNNEVDNQRSENNATLGGSSLSGASGNIGANVAAGDSNNQANDAALSASDASQVFGLMGQAAAFSAQTAAGNAVANAGSPNTATLGGSALSGATGNIAANVVAGVGNSQQNSLAASSNTATGSADATTGGVQQTYDNYTANVPHTRQVQYAAAVDATVTLDNVDLRMDQIGDVYPDIWTGNSHPAGSADGHFDLDTVTQGGSDLNDDGGALAFNSTSDSVLSGTISGVMPSARTVYTFHSNDATLGGNALAGASGNIGVNVAAGTNNLQRNSLSIASSMGGNGGNGGGGEM